MGAVTLSRARELMPFATLEPSFVTGCGSKQGDKEPVDRGEGYRGCHLTPRVVTSLPLWVLLSCIDPMFFAHLKPWFVTDREVRPGSRGLNSVTACCRPAAHLIGDTVEKELRLTGVQDVTCILS